MRSHPLKGETNETTHAETRQLQRLVIGFDGDAIQVREQRQRLQKPRERRGEAA